MTPLTLAAALDKNWARRLVQWAGGRVPWGYVYIGPDGPFDPFRDADTIRWPVIVKPAWEGSSKGIRKHCLIDRPGPNNRVDPQKLFESLRHDYQQPILVEEFIDGDELTVGIVGNDPPTVLGVMRVIPNQADGPFVYSLEVKRDFRNLVRYECPAQLPPGFLAEVEEAALTAYQALGCRDVARIDFRLRDGMCRTSSKPTRCRG